MKVIRGDLLKLAKEGQFDVIIHGCNCFCTMKSGIAGQIVKEYPMIAEIDQLTSRGDEDKLGKFFPYHTDDGFTIVNAYTQFGFGRDAEVVYVDYGAIEDVFSNIAKHYKGKRIGFPKIGAGLANGNWNIISAIIEKELEGEDYTLVVLE